MGRSDRPVPVLLAALLTLAGAPAGAAEEALILAAGSRHAGDLVVSRRPAVVAGTVDGTLVSTLGAVELSGHVTGDVVLLGSDAVLRGRARVDGRLLAVGGEVRFEDGASAAGSLGGAVLSLRALEAAFLTELRTSPLRSASVSPLLLSFRLLILTGWLGMGLLLLYAVPRRAARAAGQLPGRLPLLAGLGLAAVLAGVLISMLALGLLPARFGIAVLAALVAGLLLAKAFGLAVVFLSLGRLLTRGARRGSAAHGDPAALSLGLLALGAVSLLPAAGAVVWAVASLIGIGLALGTAFGGDQVPLEAPRLTRSHAAA